jgi:hypothetical protein
MLFFFHLRTAEGVERDEVGLSLESLDSAYLSACDTIPAAAAELLRARQDPMACAYLIHDEAGRLLIEVPFAELVAPRPGTSVPAGDRRRRGEESLVRTARLASDRANAVRPDDAELRRQLDSRAREIAESIRSHLAPAVSAPGIPRPRCK